MVDAQGEISQ